MPTVSKPSLNFLPTYRFRANEKDPIIDRVRTLMEDTGTTIPELSRNGGASQTTIRNWLDGPTRKPQFALICASVRAMGYDMAIVPATPKGNGKGWAATMPKIIKPGFKTERER